MAFPSTLVIVRGATVQFSTNFYGVNGALLQPDSATVHIVYQTSNNENVSADIPMVPPVGSATSWTALWDTRGVQAPRVVNWSIHTGTDDPIPVSVEDGQFQLTANLANLPTF